jgi:hypothetical protein
MSRNLHFVSQLLKHSAEQDPHFPHFITVVKLRVTDDEVRSKGLGKCKENYGLKPFLGLFAYRMKDLRSILLLTKGRRYQKQR